MNGNVESVITLSSAGVNVVVSFRTDVSVGPKFGVDVSVAPSLSVHADVPSFSIVIHVNHCLQSGSVYMQECKSLTDDQVSSIVVTKLLFERPMEEIRKGLHAIDEGCPHMHFTRLCPVTVSDSDSESESDSECDSKTIDSKKSDSFCERKSESDSDESGGDEPSLPDYELSGLPLPYSVAQCDSKLFHIMAASVHYPLLRKFFFHVSLARKHHHIVFDIDDALCTGDFERLMKLCCLQTMDIFKVSGDDDVLSSKRDNSTLGLPGMEAYLKVKHAELITNFEKEVGDDPEFACCSCESLFQRKNVTSLKNWDVKFTSQAWKELKQYILRHNEHVNMESLFVCSYCRPILNVDNMPRRCILNGLEKEPIPAELSVLDALSKQLIQRANRSKL